jgi:hypothetical protein
VNFLHSQFSSCKTAGVATGGAGVCRPSNSVRFDQGVPAAKARAIQAEPFVK